MKKLSILLLWCFLFNGCSAQSGLVLSGSNLETELIASGDGSCSAPEGSTRSTGDYTAESFLNGSKVAQLDLGHLTLASGTAHNDLHLLPTQIEGEAFYKLAQYDTCNSERVRLFSVDEAGVIHQLKFVKETVSSDELSTDSQGTVGFKDGLFSFCPYDNTSGEQSCDFYEYKNGALEYVRADRS